MTAELSLTPAEIRAAAAAADKYPPGWGNHYLALEGASTASYDTAAEALAAHPEYLALG
jgi:hypothetical protein